MPVIYMTLINVNSTKCPCIFTSGLNMLASHNIINIMKSHWDLALNMVTGTEWRDHSCL